MKFLAGFLAFISSLYTTGEPSKPLVPLNTTIISYSETYFAPVVVEPGNFPRARSSILANQPKESETFVAPKIVIEPAPVPKPVLPPPPPPVTVLPPPPPAPTVETYLANPEPTVDWYMPVTFRRDSTDNSDLPEMIFSREFWRMEVLAYWAPGSLSKTSAEKDYFKLEVYEKGTDALIYTMTSGTEEAMHKFQAFKKPGTYYFKTYLKNPSQFEITFTFH